MAAPPSLLSAAVRQLSRSTYGVVVNPVRGFQIFRIDGYSWTKTLPPGELISSRQFAVGGRYWRIDYYPNGAAGGGDDDSDAISLYLNLAGCYEKQRVRAEYKFSLLDAAGNAAYELSAATRIFASGATAYVGVSKDELERRRETLLRDDCLAVRCDVGLTEIAVLDVSPKEGHHHSYSNWEGDDDSDWEGDGGSGESRRRRRQPLDDGEYIRRTLAKNRRA